MSKGTERANRPQRTPLGRRNILTADSRPGYVRRWVNDVDDRLTRAQGAGYNFVADGSTVNDKETADRGSAIHKSVGGGLQAYLMEIPEGFYNEDQVTKRKENDARVAGLKPNQGEGQYGDVKVA